MLMLTKARAPQFPHFDDYLLKVDLPVSMLTLSLVPNPDRLMLLVFVPVMMETMISVSHRHRYPADLAPRYGLFPLHTKTACDCKRPLLDGTLGFPRGTAALPRCDHP